MSWLQAQGDPGKVPWGPGGPEASANLLEGGARSLLGLRSPETSGDWVVGG